MRAYPRNVTFYDLIRRNKRKSVLLIAGMILVVVALGAAIAAVISVTATGGELPSLWPSALVGAVAATVVAVLASLWSFYGGSDAILRIAGAKPMEKSQDPQLFNVVEELSIAAGTPMPRIHLIDDPEQVGDLLVR